MYLLPHKTNKSIVPSNQLHIIPLKAAETLVFADRRVSPRYIDVDVVLQGVSAHRGINVGCG